MTTDKNKWRHRFCLPWADADVVDEPDGTPVWKDVEGDDRVNDDPLITLRESTNDE